MKNSFSKKITSLFLTVLMILSLFTAMIVPSVAEDAHVHAKADDVKTVDGVPGCFATTITDIMSINVVAKRELSFTPGGNNTNNGEIDGNPNTGVAMFWTHANAKDVYITYLFNESYLITDMTILYTPWAIGAGFKVYLSNDGGVTWGNPEITYVAPDGAKLMNNLNKNSDGTYQDPSVQKIFETFGQDGIDRLQAENNEIKDNSNITYQINKGNGVIANAIKFEYTGSVKTYLCDLWEIDASAYKVLPCTYDKGVITGQPNCSTNMEITYTCEKCGKEDVQKIEDTKSGAHGWVKKSSESQAPTSTANGFDSLFCIYCGKTKKADVPATGHTWEVQSVVDPTCAEEGYTVYKATDADLTYVGDYTESIGHIWHGGKVTKLATTTETGIRTYYCLRDDCDETRDVTMPKVTISDETFTIGKNNITKVDTTNPDFPAEAMMDGLTSGQFWSGMGMNQRGKDTYNDTATIIFDDEYIVVSGALHIAGNYVKAKIDFYNANGDIVLTYDTGYVNEGASIVKQDLSDLLKTGVRTSKIVVTILESKYGGVNAYNNYPAIYELVLNAHVCKFDDSTITDVVPADCKAGTEGSYKNKCYLCEKEKTFVIPVSEGHNFDNVIQDVAPTCGSNGVGHATCTNCEALVEGVVIPATGEHNMELTYEFDPGCGSYGYGRYACENCSYSSENTLIPPTGDHLWDNGVSNGDIRKFTCQVCEATKEVDLSGSHSFTKKVIEPTCTTVGYTEYTCSDCDITYGEDYIAALGHDFDDGEILKHASVYSEGLKLYTCKRECGTTRMEILEKVTMSTSSKKLTNSHIVSAKVFDPDGNELEPLYWGTADPKYMFDGEKWADFWGNTGSWYTMAKQYVEITFDNEYYLTSAWLYYASNYNNLKIEFFNANGDLVGAYVNTTLDGNTTATKDTAVPIELTQAVGQMVKMVRVTSVEAKSPSKPGNGLQIYELDFIAHEHQFDDNADVVEGTCTEKGTVTGTCYQCGATSTFYTDYVHEFGDLIVDETATCVSDGVGHYECGLCGEKVENIEIPATGVHDYSKEVIDVKADCQTKGASHMECVYCGTTQSGSQKELDYGAHNYIWATSRATTFTRKGEEVHKCSVCGELDPDEKPRETNNTVAMSARFVQLDDYSIRYTGFEGVRATFTLNRTEFNNVKSYGHDMKITVYVTVNGVEKSIVIENMTDNTFSVVVKGLGYEDKIEKIRINVELSDEYGKATRDFDNIKGLESDGTSMYDVANANKSNRRFSAAVRWYYQTIVDYVNSK